jgi:TonB family protein
MVETGTTLSRRVLKQAGAMSFALTFASGVWAQSSTATAAKAAAAPASSASSVAAADKAQRETERTLYWIRVLSDKPAVKPTATAAAPAAPAPRPAAAAPAPRPAAEPVRVAQAPAQPAPSVVKPVAQPAAAATADGATGGNVSLGARSTPEPTPSAGTVATSSPAGADASPAVGGAIAAPSLTPPATLDVPPVEVEEPDPGLIMVSSVDPEFPMNLMRRLRKGEVEVRFEVGPDGQVDVVSVEKSTHHGLDNAALDAVRQWRFKPTPHGHAALVDLAFNMDQ